MISQFLGQQESQKIMMKAAFIFTALGSDTQHNRKRNDCNCLVRQLGRFPFLGCFSFRSWGSSLHGAGAGEAAGVPTALGLE